MNARERESRGDRKGGRLQAVIKVAEDGLAELTLNRGSEETGAGPARVWGRRVSGIETQRCSGRGAWSRRKRGRAFWAFPVIRKVPVGLGQRAL